MSLPYEPGRAAFASLRRTQEDLAALAGGRIEEFPARAAEYGPGALAHVERHLFADAPPPGRELEGAIRFFEAAGAAARSSSSRRSPELVATGTPLEEIALVVPSVERWRAPLETVLGTLGIPFAIDGRVRLGQTPFGQALLSLLRFEWQQGGRRELYAYLRSPFSGFTRSNVDFLEGGCAAAGSPRDSVERRRSGCATGSRSRRWRRSAARPGRSRRLAGPAAMLRGAHGLEAPPVGDVSRADLRAYDASSAACSTSWTAGRALGGELAADEVLAALEHVECGSASPSKRSRRCPRARAGAHRRFAAVFLLGLEEGTLPRRVSPSPFLDDDARARSTDSRSRLVRPDPVERERYLFYTACTRATRRLTLVREAATDEGSPREPSPFWDEVVALFDAEDVRRWTRRRPLSQLTWALEEAPTERERCGARAARGASRGGSGPGGRERLGAPPRARRARVYTRDESTTPRVLAELSAKTPFNVTELERFADCSSAWLFDGWSRRAGSTAASTRSCAARSPTRLCTASTPACRRRSAATRRGEPPRRGARVPRRVPRGRPRRGQVEMTSSTRESSRASAATSSS